MKLQRTHFNAIAAALRGRLSDTGIRKIADVLGTHCPDFDRQRFMDKALRGPTQEAIRAAFKRRHTTIILRRGRAARAHNGTSG